KAEKNSQVKAIWERFLEYELGHLQVVMDLFKQYEKRDPSEILPERLPDPIAYESQREFVRATLKEEVKLSAAGTQFVDRSKETDATKQYRAHMNSEGSPSEAISADYQWQPGTELSKQSKNKAA